MCELIINGGRALCGEVLVQGSKNAVLPVLAASVLTDEQCIIHNCPLISDTETAIEILKALGCRGEISDGKAVICAENADNTKVPKELMQRMRSSVNFMGAVLARGGEVVVYRPGGCCLGERPIDMHISSLCRLGAEVYECGDCLCCSLKRVPSGDVTLLYPSVGVTENIMLMCAARNCGVRIYNPAREPEIVQLQNVLNLMGGDIRGAGTDMIRICPGRKLGGFDISVVPDRIAAATYACMTAVCGGDVFLNNIDYEHIRIPLSVLSDAGCSISRYDGGVRIRSGGRLIGIHKIKTLPYPGFPTDVQPMLCAAMAKSDGILNIDETVFEGRFSYIPELVKMGADITMCSCSAEIRGVQKLFGAKVSAKDLRGGAALITAGLAAEGTTIVGGMEYVNRGYEKIDEVLVSLGADVRLNRN